MSGIDSGSGGSASSPVPVLDALTSTGVGTLLVVGLAAVKAQVGGAPLANRKGIYLNPQSLNIHLGFNAGVTTVTGLEISNNSLIYIAADENAEVWLIRTAAGGSCAVWEVA